MAHQPRPLPLRTALGGLKRGFAALSIRNYRLYWWGQVVSLIGTWMQQVSLPWLVLAQVPERSRFCYVRPIDGRTRNRSA